MPEDEELTAEIVEGAEEMYDWFLRGRTARIDFVVWQTPWLAGSVQKPVTRKQTAGRRGEDRGESATRRGAGYRP